MGMFLSGCYSTMLSNIFPQGIPNVGGDYPVLRGCLLLPGSVLQALEFWVLMLQFKIILTLE